MLCGCFSFVSKLVLTNHADDRGVKIDTELVEQAIACELMLSDAMSKKAYELTGLENPNSVSQLKTWLEERGIPMDTLGKKDVAQMITELDKNGVDAEALDMLKLRLQMAKSSVKKYQAAECCVCSDGRARGLFQFYGASRTGRYSGRNIQLQNLPQNHISTLDEARTLVKLGCFDMVESMPIHRYGDYHYYFQDGIHVCIPEKEFENLRWELRFLMEGESRIEHNRKNCALRHEAFSLRMIP